MVRRLKMNWRFFLGKNTERIDLINGRLLLNMFEDSLAKKKKKPFPRHNLRTTICAKN